MVGVQQESRDNMLGNEEKDIRIEVATKKWLDSVEEMQKMIQKMIDGEVSKGKLSLPSSKMKKLYRYLEDLIKIY